MKLLMTPVGLLLIVDSMMKPANLLMFVGR